jgi:hypothetical protein
MSGAPVVRKWHGEPPGWYAVGMSGYRQKALASRRIGVLKRQAQVARERMLDAQSLGWPALAQSWAQSLAEAEAALAAVTAAGAKQPDKPQPKRRKTTTTETA